MLQSLQTVTPRRTRQCGADAAHQVDRVERDCGGIDRRLRPGRALANAAGRGDRYGHGAGLRSAAFRSAAAASGARGSAALHAFHTARTIQRRAVPCRDGKILRGRLHSRRPVPARPGEPGGALLPRRRGPDDGQRGRSRDATAQRRIHGRDAVPGRGRASSWRRLCWQRTTPPAPRKRWSERSP